MLSFTTESGSNPLDIINEVSNVLSLLTDTLCFNSEKLNENSQAGLFLILYGCETALRTAVKQLVIKQN